MSIEDGEEDIPIQTEPYNLNATLSDILSQLDPEPGQSPPGNHTEKLTHAFLKSRLIGLNLYNGLVHSHAFIYMH